MNGNAGGGGEQGICAGAGNTGGVRPQARQEVGSQLISVVFTFSYCLLGSGGEWVSGTLEDRANAVEHEAAVCGRWTAGTSWGPDSSLAFWQLPWPAREGSAGDRQQVNIDPGKEARQPNPALTSCWKVVEGGEGVSPGTFLSSGG